MARKNDGNPKVRGLYLKRGKYVYQPPQVDGVRPAVVPLKTDNFAVAVKKIDDLKKKNFVKAHTDPLDEQIEAWKKAKRKTGEHRSKKTSDIAQTALNNYKKHTSKPPHLVAASDIEDWKLGMLGAGLSKATVNGYMGYVQSFFTWLKDEGRIPESPFDDKQVSYPKNLPTRRGMGLTKKQRDEILAHELLNDPERIKKDPLILELKKAIWVGFLAGLRKDELLAIRPSWFILDAKGRPSHIYVQNETGKDGTSSFTVKDDEAKMVPISKRLRKFLKKVGIDHSPYFIRPDKTQGDSRYRWEWKRRWETLFTTAGYPNVTPHIMRHTYVTLLLSAPPEVRPSLLQLERWTGTSVEELKKTYAHVLENRAEIDAAD